MKWMSISLAVVLLAIVHHIAAAQDDPAEGAPADAATTPAVEASPPAAAPELASIRLHMQDGSILGGNLLAKEVVVATEFGTLKIPVENILSFTPGLASRTDLKERLDGLFEQLGDEDAARRDAAFKQLLKEGLAIRDQLDRFRKDSNAQRAEQIKKLEEELDKLETEIDLSGDSEGGVRVYRQEDRIVTTDFTVLGKIGADSFELVNKFGTLKVNLADISRAQRDGSGPEEFRKSLSVAGQNLAPLNYKKTQIRVQRGDRVTISATGTVVMSPWGSNVLSTPDGSPNWGWYRQGSIPTGALCARIGSGGTEFKVGAKNTFTAKSSGRLEFGVAMNPSYVGNAFPGEYRLKVKVEPKGN